MVSKKPSLSKSRLISAWQCPKKLHLEKHHPELGVTTPQMESLFATGHRVGAIAQQLFGGPDGVEIPFSRNTGAMVAETRRLIESEDRRPIYEATFRCENVLVRVDVLLPDRDGWRAIEVKASTSVKDYHVLDCAIQDWVLRNAGLELDGISLAHIDNQFVYQGDGNYEGLFEVADLTDTVRTVEPAVVEMIAKARDAVLGYFPEVIVGAQCSKPYDCQFQSHCWPGETEYPIRGLGGSKAKLVARSRSCRTRGSSSTSKLSLPRSPSGKGRVRMRRYPCNGPATSTTVTGPGESRTCAIKSFSIYREHRQCVISRNR